VAPKKQRRLPTIQTRDIIDGYLHTFDADGRLCLDTVNEERVILVKDLRVYGDGLHIGRLGWTIPATSDGYTITDVLFDTGHRFRVNRHAFERVDPRTAEATASELIDKYRNTRFDLDPTIAQQRREEWVLATYGKYMTLKNTSRGGAGDQELYAFTFPSLMELARLRGQAHYPVKIGYSKNASDGAFGRIRQQILELAGYPEPPEVLCVWRTWDGRMLETLVHRHLRKSARAVPNSLGKEWFHTTLNELVTLLKQSELPVLPKDRVLVGADETPEEGFTSLMKQGATVEIGIVPGSASVRLGIRYPNTQAEQPNSLRADADEEPHAATSGGIFHSRLGPRPTEAGVEPDLI